MREQEREKETERVRESKIERARERECYSNTKNNTCVCVRDECVWGYSFRRSRGLRKNI